MKIKVTEIECNANELRQSNTIADAFANMLRNAFNGRPAIEEEDDGDSEDN